MFIVVEGADGSGKTTFSKMLHELIPNSVLVREPGGSASAERIRDLFKDPTLNLNAEAEFLMMSSSRAQLVGDVIVPSLQAGKTVICDRYTMSSEVYQGMIRGIPATYVEFINGFATRGIQPDLTVFISVDEGVSLQRTGGRGEQCRLENTVRRSTVIESYDTLLRTYTANEKPLYLIDGNLPLEDLQKAAKNLAKTLNC